MDERDWSLSSEDLNASRKRRGSKALELTSPAFSDGGEIPRECGYKNGNQEPPLRITADGGKELGATGIHSLALIMDDPDAMGAVGKVWVHWVVWNFTWFADGKPNWSSRHITKQGMTDFGEVGYGDQHHQIKDTHMFSNFTHWIPNWIFLTSLQRLMLKKQWKVTS